MNRLKQYPDLGETQHVICTCYFRSKKDPQHGIYIEEKYEYIKPWYESMLLLTQTDNSVKGIIFYSGLSDEFVERYNTENIIFIPCRLGSYSTNDERFFVYKEFLENYEQVKRAFFTDISDVTIKKNPIQLVRPRKLYIGKDMPQTPKINKNPWAVNKANQMDREGGNYISIDPSFGEVTLFNAGVIGGDRKSLVRLFDNMCFYFDAINSQNNNNMMVLHYVLWKHFTISRDIVAGKPLTSDFKAFEYDADVYIVHK